MPYVMSLEFWSTVASIGTFLVITATAIAALVQLRHMRAANQLVTWQSFASAYEGPDLRPSFDYVRSELASRLEDKAFRAEIRTGRVERSRHPEITVCNFFDQWGLYYRSGVVDRNAFMRTNGGIVLFFWNALAPVIAMLADPVHGNLAFQDFEYLAVEAVRWRQRHPAGDYQHRASRMPLVDQYEAQDKSNS